MALDMGPLLSTTMPARLILSAMGIWDWMIFLAWRLVR
jgi:hypothetical protein